MPQASNPKPHSQIRIAITGPESTGKSSLAENLARQYKTVWIPEYSREYLKQLGKRYQYHDILAIAKGQYELERKLSNGINRFLFIDTDFIVCKIWCEVKFGKCHPWINEMIDQHRYNLYLLCKPDLPWVEDPLRENPDDRAILFELYKDELEHRKFPYAVISGVGDERVKNAMNAITTQFPDITSI
jgi:NadR type nicotinamide-nucleotide adenylyltransferase